MLPPGTSLSRLPVESTLTESEVTAYAMCGRFGSMLTVCASPMWLVSPISFGRAGLEMSMISRPPCAVLARPKVPPSWQRPLASLASISSCASLLTARGLVVLRTTPPFGVASTSCCRPSELSGLLGQAAEGWPATKLGATTPPLVSLRIV